MEMGSGKSFSMDTQLPIEKEAMLVRLSSQYIETYFFSNNLNSIQLFFTNKYMPYFITLYRIMFQLFRYKVLFKICM